MPQRRSASNSSLVSASNSSRASGWHRTGRATLAASWAPSTTSLRSTIADYKTAHLGYARPRRLRNPHGCEHHSRTEETFICSPNLKDHLHRNVALRQATSVSGISFVHDVAKSIPLPKPGQPNPLCHPPKKPQLRNFISPIKTSPAASNDKIQPSPAAGGIYALQRPAHGRSRVFIDAAFNASNFGCSQRSQLGVLNAQSFHTSKVRPFGSQPSLFKGNAHSIPKFSIWNTKANRPTAHSNGAYRRNWVH